MKLKILLIIFFLTISQIIYSKDLIDENKIHKNLRCLVCQGQSISDSNSEFAITLKLVVKDLIAEGKTEAEIYNFLADKYGDWILYKPRMSQGNIALWIIPYLALIIGGFFIIIFLKKRPKKK